MKLTSITACLPLLFATSACAAEQSPDWNSLLTNKPQVKLPAPLPKVEWRPRLAPALKLAKETGRPLFVTFRCLSCKQCADFDKSVLEGGPELNPLLSQFVTVRITNAEHIDRRLFPFEGYQDLDLSWWRYLLSSDGELYGIFGGRDDVSVKTRISVKALANTLQRVLNHHYDPKRAQWNVDGPKPDPSAKYVPNYKLPGFKSWAKRQREKVGCMHCHHVVEVLGQDKIDRGTFDKKRDLQMWPLPENVGIVLDRDHGLLVKSVKTGGPAANAGIQAGDVLGAANNTRLYGQADFRGVLHRGPKGDGEISVHWLRDGKVMHGKLRVKDGWRKTSLNWRMSVSQGNIGAGPGGFFPLRVNDGQRKRLGIKPGSMAIEPFMGKKQTQFPAHKAGLRRNHVITAVNGESPDLIGRAFLVWFRLKFSPGDKVTLTVLDGAGKKRNVSYTLK
jgi:hypothetical protein